MGEPPLDTINSPRDALLDAILDMELSMFLAASRLNGATVAEEHTEAFHTMRWMTHSIHTETTLVSYYHDLQAAQMNDRNLLLEKYALMNQEADNVSTSPLVDTIAAAESAWMAEASTQYPHALKSSNNATFQHVIACELETLSDETLEHYHNEVQHALQEKRNLVLERHDALCKRLGYASLADREAQLAAAH